MTQDLVIDRFHRRREEEAPAAPQLGQERGVIDEVLDLDGGVERDVRERVVQRPRQPDAVRRTVEEVRIAE